MIAYPALDRYAYRGNFTVLDPDSCFPGDSARDKAEVGQCLYQDGFETSQEFVQVSVVMVEVNDRVTDELAGGV